MQNKQKTIYLVTCAVAILLLVWAFYKHPENKKRQGEEWAGWEQDKPLSGNEESGANTTTGTKKLSYTEAVKTYKFRFQFVKCSGNPGLLSVKRGTPVMLDNRDSKAHTIRANGQSFRIAAYDYAVVYPNIITRDNTDLTISNVTCDGGGAATLNVER